MKLTHFHIHAVNRRRVFDPANQNDLKELKYFKTHSKWKNGCPFFLEDPFVDIPAMCESKFTSYMLRSVK